MATAQNTPAANKAPTFAERAAERAALAKQLEEMDAGLSTEKATALQQATEAHVQAMVALGFTVKEVAADVVKLVPKVVAKPKLPPVYVSVDGKKGWSGKGKQPQWLTDAIAATPNSTLDTFKVKAPAA